MSFLAQKYFISEKKKKSERESQMHFKGTYGARVIIVKLHTHLSNLLAQRLYEIIVSKILFGRSQALSCLVQAHLPRP